MAGDFRWNFQNVILLVDRRSDNEKFDDEEPNVNTIYINFYFNLFGTKINVY